MTRQGTVRLVGYLAGLVAIFAVALGVGHTVGPVTDPAEAEEGHDMSHDTGHGGTEQDGPGAGVHHGVLGLEASAGGYGLGLEHSQLPAGRHRLAFTITGADGHPVTSYAEQHERDLHLIVVRRDLTGFQHLHPRLDATTGEWSVDVELTAGAWRVLADFQPVGAEPLVLGTDLLVPGEFLPEPLGGDRFDTSTGGYDLTLDGSVTAGEETLLTATVTRDGRPVVDLQPYLGAFGHLVSLRDGDIGYLHVHPEEDGGPGPAIAFHTRFPSAGRYRLFLDFRHADEVRTAVFTVTVEGGHDH